MDLYEYQARDLFERHGVPVLEGIVAATPADLDLRLDDDGARRAASSSRTRPRRRRRPRQRSSDWTSRATPSAA